MGEHGMSGIGCAWLTPRGASAPAATSAVRGAGGRRVRGRWEVLLAAGTLVVGTLAPAVPVPAQETRATSSSSASQAANDGPWQPLCDGQSLAGWKVTDFGGQGEVRVQGGAISLGMGSPLTGITYVREFPRDDYEIRWEAQRVDGVDFFSTLTFPVGNTCCSLVVGGWGGAVVGLSCLDDADASQNETTRHRKFNRGQWYGFRLQVRRDRLQAWMDDQSVVDVDIRDRKLTTRIEVKRAEPLGLSTWETHGAVRKVEYRQLAPDR